MSQTVVVVYDGTVLRPETPLDLEPDRRYLITLEPVASVVSSESAWDVLDTLAGTVDAPEDWAAEHDHYLYGTSRRADEQST